MASYLQWSTFTWAWEPCTWSPTSEFAPLTRWLRPSLKTKRRWTQTDSSRGNPGKSTWRNGAQAHPRLSQCHNMLLLLSVPSQTPRGTAITSTSPLYRWRCSWLSDAKPPRRPPRWSPLSCMSEQPKHYSSQPWHSSQQEAQLGQKPSQCWPCEQQGEQGKQGGKWQILPYKPGHKQHLKKQVWRSKMASSAFLSTPGHIVFHIYMSQTIQVYKKCEKFALTVIIESRVFKTDHMPQFTF